jgi:pimeloyl-ACP methyl ester carboxylesterase
MPQAASAVTKTGYAQVPGGPNMYYEIHGTAASQTQAPLILLHGGFGSTEMVASLTAHLSRSRQVIAADLQAHGRTADIDRPITYEALGDDVAALAKHLQITKVDMMGYSLGAGTALQTTIRHAALVRKLVVISTPFRRDGWYAEVVAQMNQMGPATAEMLKMSPIYKTYARVAPRPEDWTAFVTKMSHAIKQDYDFTRDVAAIKAPVMLVFGDADSVRPAHIVEFFQLLGGGKKDGGWDNSGVPNSRLAILPGTTHYNIPENPELASMAAVFLDAATPATS